MTDIDEGSFVEFTSSIPEGRIIPHVDSLKKLRDNLYFTTESQPNITQYSTSSKNPSALYGFHKLVDAVQKQKLLPQMSQVEEESSSYNFGDNADHPPHMKPADSGAVHQGNAVGALRSDPPKGAMKVLNSTLLDGRRASQCPLQFPDISSLSLNSKITDFTDDSIPLTSGRNKLPDYQIINSSQFKIEEVVHGQHDDKQPHFNNTSSLTSEDVPLAESRVVPHIYTENKKTLTGIASTACRKSLDSIFLSNKPPNVLKDSCPDGSSSESSIEEIPQTPRAATKTPTQRNFRLQPNFNKKESPLSLSKKLLLMKQQSPAVPITLVTEVTHHTPPVKSSVCHWVVNSPFNDGSFDSSFLRRASVCEGSGAPVVSTVLESSEEEDEHKNSMPPNRVDARATHEFLLKGDENSHERKQCRDKTDFNQGSSLRSGSDTSLNLQLETSRFTGATVATVSRVADTQKHCSKPSSTYTEMTPIKQSPKLPRSTPPCQKALLLTDSDSDGPIIPTVRKSVHRNTRKAASITKQSATDSRIQRKPNNTKRDNLCASPTLRVSEAVTSGSEERKQHIRHDSDSSESDGLSNYLQRWRSKQQVLVTSDESDHSSFIADSDDEPNPVEFYLPTLTERASLLVKKGKHLGTAKGDSSLSDELSTGSKVPTNEIPRIYSLEDSYDSLPSPSPHLVLPSPTDKRTVRRAPQTPVIILTDSDDECGPLDPIRKLVTPRVPKTPKLRGSRTNRSLCPNSAAPVLHIKPGASRVAYRSDAVTHGTPTLSFLASLSSHYGNDRIHPDAVQFHKNFNRTKDNLIKILYKMFNSMAFNNELPSEMRVSWNVSLTKTAGRCHCQLDRSKPNDRGARIELSTKVVDSCVRLRDTLIHELCHAAAWIVSGYKGGHGPTWKAWLVTNLLKITCE